MIYIYILIKINVEHNVITRILYVRRIKATTEPDGVRVHYFDSIFVEHSSVMIIFQSRRTIITTLLTVFVMTTLIIITFNV